MRFIYITRGNYLMPIHDNTALKPATILAACESYDSAIHTWYIECGLCGCRSIAGTSWNNEPRSIRCESCKHIHHFAKGAHHYAKRILQPREQAFIVIAQIVDPRHNHRLGFYGRCTCGYPMIVAFQQSSMWRCSNCAQAHDTSKINVPLDVPRIQLPAGILPTVHTVGAQVSLAKHREDILIDVLNTATVTMMKLREGVEALTEQIAESNRINRS